MAEIGKQIRKRREELGLTQEELASRLGYKSKTTIAKIENGTNDIVQSKVVEFAKALDTTPAYLMGWESLDFFVSNKKASNDMFINLTKSQKDSEKSKLTKTYTQLTSNSQKRLLAYAEKLLSLQKMDVELNAAHERTDTKITEEMKQHDDDIMDDDNF